MSPNAKYLRLGLHLEYLRGITSNSGLASVHVDQFPHLRENQTTWRYPASKIAAIVTSLLSILEELKLKKSLETAAAFRPLIQEVVEFMASSADPNGVYLQDHFADKVVKIADDVTTAVKDEIK